MNKKIYPEKYINLNIYIITHYIKHKLTDITVIHSSNRLSILSCCSNIIVLKSGSITQQGSHEELIDCNGEYNNLFVHQMDFN